MQLARGKHKEKPTKSAVKSVKFKRHGGPRKTDTEAEKLRDASVCKKKGLKLLLPGMVEAFDRGLLRYWLQRYSLFSRFDDGVKIDEQGLYSVTPEEIAKHQAARCGSHGTIFDAFTGLGGNAIQFASRKNHVIAIDIDSKRIECARHNVEVYGVAHKILETFSNWLHLLREPRINVLLQHTLLLDCYLLQVHESPSKSERTLGPLVESLFLLFCKKPAYS